MIDIDEVLNELHEMIESRGLRVMALDALGHSVDWLDPVVYDIAFAPAMYPWFDAGFGRAGPLRYRYTLECLLVPVLKRLGWEGVGLAPIAAEVTEQIIAFGKRNAMAGRISG